MTRAVLFTSIFWFVALGACMDGEPATLTELKEDLFTPRCGASSCHGGSGPVRGLDLVGDPYGTLVDVDSVEDPAVKRVVPGDPEASLLFQVLNGPVGTTGQMPVGVVLPAEEIERVRSWIEAGALDN